MGRRIDHLALIDRGLDLHEARKYQAALAYFDRALSICSQCPVAEYNRANTLHMVGREAEAEVLLRGLIGATPQELGLRCPAGRIRSLQVDAHYLLFLVLIHGQGFSEEAFGFAEEHLRQRRRGLLSVWSVREVRADLAGLRREWNEPG